MMTVVGDPLRGLGGRTGIRFLRCDVLDELVRLDVEGPDVTAVAASVVLHLVSLR
jgi:hypothetical protein